MIGWHGEVWWWAVVMRGRDWEQDKYRNYMYLSDMRWKTEEIVLANEWKWKSFVRQIDFLLKCFIKSQRIYEPSIARPTAIPQLNDDGAGELNLGKTFKLSLFATKLTLEPNSTGCCAISAGWNQLLDRWLGITLRMRWGVEFNSAEYLGHTYLSIYLRSRIYLSLFHPFYSHLLNSSLPNWTLTLLYASIS